MLTATLSNCNADNRHYVMVLEPVTVVLQFDNMEFARDIDRGIYGFSSLDKANRFRVTCNRATTDPVAYNTELQIL